MADPDQTASEEAVCSVLPVCYSDKHFVSEFQLLKPNIVFENRKRKVFEPLEHLLIFTVS